MILILLSGLAAAANVSTPARSAAVAIEQFCLPGGPDFTSAGELARKAGWTDTLSNIRSAAPEARLQPLKLWRSPDGSLSLAAGYALSGLKQPHTVCEVMTQSASADELIAAAAQRFGAADPGSVAVWTKTPTQKVTVISRQTGPGNSLAVVQFGHWVKDATNNSEVGK